MAKNITALLALLGAASINCASPQPAEHPQQLGCSSTDLSKKIGFSIEFENSEKMRICYRIQSAAGLFYEYVGLCEPTAGTFDFYQHFTSLNKGGMEMNYITELNGVLVYVPFFRSPSGEVTSPAGTEAPKEEIEQKFKDGAELLEHVKNIPQVCKELQKYQDNASKH